MSLYLLPETELREDGAGPVIETPPAEVVVTLGITQALEREDLQVSVWGSEDGESWGARPLVEFPAKSYCGRYSIPLNLREFPGVKRIRAVWKMHSWKRQDPETFFGFYIELAPVQVQGAAVAAAAGAG